MSYELELTMNTRPRVECGTQIESWPEVNSWNDLDLFLAGICNNNPKKAGHLFEHFCKEFLGHAPSARGQFSQIWLEKEVPSDVRKILNLPDTDHGVDLVCKTPNGQYAVVQCKYTARLDKKVLNWTQDNLSSWLAASTLADIRILFTNADGIDKVSLEKAKEKDFRIFNISHLKTVPQDGFIKIVEGLNGVSSRKKIESLIPRDYQEDAIRNCIRGLASASRGKLILPCGAGKTLTALWINERIQPSKTLVLVPSLALLAQFKTVWRQHESRSTRFFCVCSEKDIAVDDDEPSFNIEEISAKVTTDPKEIRKLLQQSDGPLVVYGTYQSSGKIAEALRGTKLTFDLTICDEAHRTAGSKTGVFATIHSNSIRSNKRLYMTATPRIVSDILQEKLGQKYKYLADMNDESIYGAELYRMTFSEAIEKGILVDYHIVVVGVSDSEVQKAITSRKWVSENATIEDIAQNYALQKAVDKYGITHAVTFHSSINRAQTFKERHEQFFGHMKSFHINGSYSSAERIRILDEFSRASLGAISNARCLTEGVDLPAIDAVMFCDSKTSRTDIVQAAGRALRKDKNKPNKQGYIIIPIFHRDAEKVENAILNGPFKHVVSVVRALADHDSRLEDEITQVSLGLGKRKTAQKILRIQDRVVPLIEMSGFKAKLKKSLFAHVIQKTVIPWLVQIEHLREYRKQHINEDWPSRLTEFPKGNNLGGWVHKIRGEYKRGILSPEKIDALKAIDFDFEFLKDRQARERAIQAEVEREQEKLRLEQLEKQRKEAEVEEQRRQEDLKIKEKQRQEELKREAEESEIRYEAHKWDQKFAFVKNAVVDSPIPGLEPGRYYQRVKFQEDEKEFELTTWLKEQRKSFSKGSLSSERISKFEEAGVPLDPTDHYVLDQRELEQKVQLIFLERYFRENPEVKWIATTLEFPSCNKLGVWCAQQRQAFKSKTLPDDIYESMKKAGFDFDYTYENHAEFVKNEKVIEWNRQFSLLKKYIAEYPMMPIPFGNVEYPEGNKLGKWCQGQRTSYKNGQLSEERTVKLREIGFSFVRDKESDDIKIWEAQANAFSPYMLPKISNLSTEESRYNDLPPDLTEWLKTQKKAFHNGKLTKKQVTFLKLRKVPLYQPEDITEWNDWFEKLKAFREQKFNLQWPMIHERHSPLADWCQKQIRILESDGLPFAFKMRLEGILFPYPEKKHLDSEWFIFLKHLSSRRNINEFAPSAIPGFSTWMLEQYDLHRQKRLKKRNKRALESYGIRFDFSFAEKYQDQWQWQFANLVEFKNQGRNIPRADETRQCHPSRNPIGRWCALQFIKYRIGALSNDQKNALEGVGFNFKNSSDYKFIKTDLKLSKAELCYKYGDHWFFTLDEVESLIKSEALDPGLTSHKRRHKNFNKLVKERHVGARLYVVR